MKKIVSFVLVLVIAVTCSVSVFARYNYITSFSAGADIDDNGMLWAEGMLTVDGATARITVTIQQYNGGWKDLYSKTDSSGDVAAVGFERMVSHGYEYRVKAYAEVLVNGRVVETDTGYTEPTIFFP